MLARILAPASVLVASLSFVFACSSETDPAAAPPAPLPDGAVDAPATVPDATTNEATTSEVAPDAPGPTIEIKGKLLDDLDRPIAGFKVATTVMTTAVTTAADGTFTVQAPTPPYDLAISSTTGEDVFVYAGLTRVDPIVPVPTSTLDHATATFAGTMPSITNGQGAQVIFVPSDGKTRYADYHLYFGPATSYETTFDWQGAPPFAGTLYLFQYDSGPNNPASSFLGWSKLENITIGKDETQTANFPALTDVTTSTISAVMTVPANWEKGGSIFAHVRLPGTKARLAVNQTTSPDLSFSMPVPVFDQAVYGISLRATGTVEGEQSVVRKTIALGDSANVTMPAAAALTAPADNATGIDATSAITWTKTDGISYLLAYPTDEASSPTLPVIHVITASGAAKLPNLAAIGAAVPSAKKYKWFVVGYPTIASVDAFTTGGNVDWFCTAHSQIGADETTCTFSASRTFTTK